MVDNATSRRPVLRGSLVEPDKPILSSGVRRLLWLQVLLLAGGTVWAHGEAGGAALAGAAATLTLSSLGAVLLSRRSFPCYPARSLLILFALLALPYAAGLAATLVYRDLAWWTPSPFAAHLIGAAALVCLVPALTGRRGDDGKDGDTKEVQVSLDDLLHGVRIGFPGYIVRLPAGTTAGSLLRLADPSAGWLAPDRYVRVNVAQDERFGVEGTNLTATVELTPREALRGVAVPLQTLDGTMRLTIPPLTRGGSRLRLKGLGLPKGRGRRGHLYAIVTVSQAEDWTPERLAPGLFVIDVRSLTLDQFEDILASVGHEVARSRQQGPLVYVVRYEGVDRGNIATMEALLYALNRRGRAEGPVQVALFDQRGQTLSFPFGEEDEARLREVLCVPR